MARSAKTTTGSVRTDALLGLLTIGTQGSCVLVHGLKLPLLLQTGRLEDRDIRVENAPSVRENRRETTNPEADLPHWSEMPPYKTNPSLWLDLSTRSEVSMKLEECLRSANKAPVADMKQLEGYPHTYASSGTRNELLSSIGFATNVDFGITNDRGEHLIAVVPTQVYLQPAHKLIFGTGRTLIETQTPTETPTKTTPTETPLLQALESGEIRAMAVLRCMSFHDPEQKGECDREREGCALKDACLMRHLEHCEEHAVHDAFATGDDTSDAHRRPNNRPFNTDLVQNVAALLRYAQRDLSTDDARALVSAYNQTQAHYFNRDSTSEPPQFLAQAVWKIIEANKHM